MAAETNVPGKTTTGLDRTNDTMLTTDDGLTRVDEATGVITAIAPKSQIEFFTGLDPYKTESVAKQCERFYKVADFAWDAATMTDVLVAEVAFPYALLQQPFIQDKFKDYKMMRADIEYYIRSTSAAWNYGALMWGQVENYYRSTTSYNNDNGLFRTINTVALSQCKGFELDATTGESQRRTLRLQGQRGYQRITSATNTATDQPGWIGSIFCRVLNQLESASGTTPGDVTVQVFARFKNLELAGYSPAVDMARSVKFQSALTKEAERKVDVFEGVKTAKKTIEGLIGSVKDIASTMPMISELLGSVGTVVAFDKPSTVDTPKPVYTNQSASMTYGSGIDLSTKAALSPSAGLSVSPSIFGGDFINPSLLEVLMQPTLLRTIKFSPTSPAKDVWTSFPLGPATCAKVKDAVGGYDRVYQPTYMAYYSRFFKKWRGSIKVLLTFKTSPNVSCDFRVAHFPEIKSFVAPLDDYDGDIVSELVPIKGPTSWGRAFGYVEENNYLDCGELGDTDPAKYIGLFAISRASAMSTMGDTVDANIYCNVYIMAGPDFQFLQHVSDGNSFEVIDPHATQDLPFLESQSNLRDMCAQPFPGMRQMSPNPESGFVNPDPVGSITTLFKRYGNMFQSNPALGGPFNIGFCDDYDTADTALTHLALPFLFWRGGIRVALPSIPSDQRPWIIYPDTTLLDGDTPLDASRSGLVLGGAAGSTVFYEHPQYTGEFFYKTCPLAPGNPKSPIHIGQLGTGTTPATDDIWRRGLFAAAGDFMIANLSACPPIGVYASSADVKKGKGKEKMENKSDKLKMAESLRLSESTMDKLKSFIAVSSSPSKTK